MGDRYQGSFQDYAKDKNLEHLLEPEPATGLSDKDMAAVMGGMGALTGGAYNPNKSAIQAAAMQAGLTRSSSDRSAKLSKLRSKWKEATLPSTKRFNYR